MRTKDEIIQAIRNGDRNNKIYIHPVLTPEKAAKYISAFSNGSGGDIIIGIHDDGQTLRVKNYSVPFQVEKALNLLNINVNYIFEPFLYEGKKLCYISIDQSMDLVKVNDIPYKINPDGELVEMKIKTVFLSYCHADADLANIIEKSLNKHVDINVSRDINVTQYRDDLDKFMKTIRSHDFVVSIVTSKYLKSLNCMYEITELMKDSNFNDKLLFIIVNQDDAKYYKEQNRYDSFEAGIYDFNKRLSYITYWKNRGEEMEKSLKSADLPSEMMAEFALEKRKLMSIIPSTNSFMDLLRNKIGKTFKDIEKNDFKEFLDVIKG
ncbi:MULTISPECIES: toll/interleukin-1 receptor domain-containing protein [Bacillus cereus group]|uniref:toll/interleukin-1 receptor domain-containing protein n=1 Tax=Bacillus cereus group TaxID=86661 RepID=UPI00119D546F|nr:MULTISPECIES: toll/interleukin-1 receptor domain-containing protein [Bacillus cereus group]